MKSKLTKNLQIDLVILVQAAHVKIKLLSYTHNIIYLTMRILFRKHTEIE